MAQAERYVRMCIKGWTSYHYAMMNGCGNSPWKRWAEWADENRCIYMLASYDDDYIDLYHFNGKDYTEEVRTRQVLTMDGKKTIIKERRLVRAK